MSSPDQADLRFGLIDAAQRARELIRNNPNDSFSQFVLFCLAHSRHSEAQLLQDLFVLYVLRQKVAGYFVEFGATDGVSGSNTFLLESRYGWTGILAEPARGWHEKLKKSRKAKIDLRCVWSESGKSLMFKETALTGFSTLMSFAEKDNHAKHRIEGWTYEVESISLNDLLEFHNAPRRIDYISVDTEGSEYQILASFDFGRYDVSVITVEHNFTTALRESIHDLLTSKGYIRVLEPVSQWDDWYVKREILSAPK